MTKLNCKQVDIGDKCIECMRSTVFGTGLFVNRLPADNDKYIGYLCPECNFHECDRCNEKIYCDEDVTAYDVYQEHRDFSDGAYRVHEECLTKEEKKKFDELWSEEESNYEKYKDDPKNLANDPRFKHLQKEDSNEDS